MEDLIHEGYIRTQESPEVRLHYVEDVRNEKGPLVLLLHGFPEFWFAWKHYLAPLANAGFHPVALDLRGYNKSSHPEDVGEYDFAHLVEDIRKVIKKFNKKTYLVGHDWGGILTWELASRYPELCQGIVVINAPHRSAWRDDMTFQQTMKSWYTWAFQIPKLPELWLKRNNYKAIEKIFQQQSKNAQAYTPEDIECYKKALNRDKTLKSALNYYKANMKKFGKPGSRLIRNPTLVIWGEEDVALDKALLENLQHYMAAPLTKKFFTGGSHWIHREKPREVLEEMIRFFAACEREVVHV